MSFEKIKPEGDRKPARNLQLIKDESAGGSLPRIAIAQVVLAVAAVLAICYAAKVPLMTLLLSVLVAFILAPIALLLERWHVPRALSSLIAVLLFVGCLYGVAYFSYNRAVEFLDALPKYSQNIRAATLRFRKQAERIQQTTETVLPSDDRNTIRVKPESNISAWITSSVSGLPEVLVAMSFIPFLVYFMLSSRDHTRDATVRLFDPQHRQKVRVTLVGIADMFRGFLIGNLICGLFMATISAVVFGILGLPYFYFLGLISGFLSLVPYLGVILAILPPVAAGLGQLSSAEIVGIAGLVVGLHVFAINVLFPLVIGKRLRLNPLVVTISLLIWGWLWGAMGLILAVPITGAMKIIFDHVDSLRPLGAWMED